MKRVKEEHWGSEAPPPKAKREISKLRFTEWKGAGLKDRNKVEKGGKHFYGGPTMSRTYVY